MVKPPAPFMVPHQRMAFESTPLQPDPKFSWTLDQIPAGLTHSQDTVILDNRVSEQHEITVDGMNSAIKNADYCQVDEVLTRTGWGTRQRAREQRLDYYTRLQQKNTEHPFCRGHALAKKMDEIGSGFFMTDCGLNPPRRTKVLTMALSVQM